MSFESKAFRQLLGRFATGVVVITADWEGRAYGMTVNSFTSVSLEPPLVLFCAVPRGETLRAIRQSTHFGVNILAQGQKELALRFAGMTPIGEEDRFLGTEYRPASGSSSPWIEGCLGWLDCSLEQTLEAGDHLILLARVLAIEEGSGAPPLLFFRGQWPVL